MSNGDHDPPREGFPPPRSNREMVEESRAKARATGQYMEQVPGQGTLILGNLTALERGRELLRQKGLPVAPDDPNLSDH